MTKALPNTALGRASHGPRVVLSRHGCVERRRGKRKARRQRHPHGGGATFGARPRAAREAAKAALDWAHRLHGSLGVRPLRERIARHYRDAYGVSVAPERIIVTTGSSAGFVLAFLSLFDPGQRSPSPRRNIRPTAISSKRSTWSRCYPALQAGRMDHDGAGASSGLIGKPVQGFWP